MKPTPESSTQEVLAGLVERVTFHNAENGFCVLRAKLLDADMTADALILLERQLKHGESGAPRSWTST